MRTLIGPLQHQVQDIQVQFMGHEVIGNADMLEELKENVAYVMENLNFIPDEHSYVEPWKDDDN